MVPGTTMLHRDYCNQQLFGLLNQIGYDKFTGGNNHTATGSDGQIPGVWKTLEKLPSGIRRDIADATIASDAPREKRTNYLIAPPLETFQTGQRCREYQDN